MLIRYVLAGMLLTALPAKASAFPAPKGWHVVPIAAFRETEDFHYRLKQPNGGLEADGDFDGDGRTDVVRILESDDLKHCAIFVTYFPRGLIRQHEIAHFDTRCGESLYVEREDASRTLIRTWCGKDMFCQKDDPDFLHLKHTSFGFGFYEASYSIVVWDRKRSRWHEVLISD